MATCFLKERIIIVCNLLILFQHDFRYLGDNSYMQTTYKIWKRGNNHMEDWKILLKKYWR